MDAVTAFLAKILSPIFVPTSHWLLSEKRKHPTWHFETAFSAIILLAVAGFTSPDPFLIFKNAADLREFLIIWVSAFAVIGTFLHAKVGYRMAEAIEASETPSVSCYEWSGKYWLTKEILWLFVFILSGAYPAIAGSVLFILYPAWRKVHVQERKKLRG